jgi:transcriptional regulator with XRE-family HTH domain
LKRNLDSSLATYAGRLRAALQQAGKSRRQLAAALGVSEQSVAYVYHGSDGVGRFNAENSAEAAAFLGVEHYWLATGKGPRELGRGTLPTRRQMLALLSALETTVGELRALVDREL